MDNSNDEEQKTSTRGKKGTGRPSKIKNKEEDTINELDIISNYRNQIKYHTKENLSEAHTNTGANAVKYFFNPAGSELIAINDNSF